MKMMLVLALWLPLSTSAAWSAVASNQMELMKNDTAILKVVGLLEEMKTECEKEATSDKIAYDKYMCWCETSKTEKTAAVEETQKRLAAGEAFIAEAKATEAQLKTEIEGLEEDISADKDALATAEAQRSKEDKSFTAASEDMKETISLLDEAIAILSKVQLLQKGHSAAGQAQTAALVQVRSLVYSLRPKLSGNKFAGVLQKDLFDILGTFKGDDVMQGQSSFLAERQPNGLVGAAAGAKSYNSRSGAIFGILTEMKDEFARDLDAALKEEAKALAAFNKLVAAKEAEIAAAEAQKESKEKELAELLKKVAETEEEMAADKASLSADEKFLLEMGKNCETEDEEYAKRVKVRSQEIEALSQTIGILTGDNTRALFDKTLSFMQVGNRRNTLGTAARDRMLTRALDRVIQVARRNGNWQLASLAVRARLDAFTKVKEAMDKMLAELKQQQAEEYKKKELCDKEIDETEDNIKVAEGVKADLEVKHKELSNTLAETEATIATLKGEVAEAEVALKEAGEQRKAENEIYQTDMSDQRATIHVLNLALERLNAFYGDVGKYTLVSVHRHRVEPPPPKPSKTGYEKNDKSFRVTIMLQDIIKDAVEMEATLKSTEQESQKVYSEFVVDTGATIEAKRDSIALNEEKAASTKSDIGETEEAQLANEAEISKLGDLLKGLHLDCDYIIKYFDVRQTARAEEMDAITEAKAILSGADFS